MRQNELHSGDIILTHGSMRVLGHSAIVLLDTSEAAEAQLKEIQVSDVIDVAADSTDTPYVYRCKDADLALLAACIAEQFADGRTCYGKARGAGVRFEAKSAGAGAPSCDFDALYRAAKWAKKSVNNEPLSIKKGFTCAAFVVACFQAAHILFNGNMDKQRIGRMYDYLAEQRVDKKATQDDRHSLWVQHKGKSYQQYYTRQYSNVGCKAGSGTLEQHMTVAAELLTGQKEGTPSRGTTWFFPPGLAFDAKFIHSSGLKAELDSARAWWVEYRLDDYARQEEQAVAQQQAASSWAAASSVTASAAQQANDKAAMILG